MPRQYQVRTGPIVNDAASFSPEMVQGSFPPQGKVRRPPRIPGPVFDPTGAAPFSVEMSAGWQPQRPPRLHLAPRLGASVFVDVPPDISPEMVAGCLYPSPKLPQLSRLGWQDAQITEVPASFSSEVSQGWARFTRQYQRRSGPVITEDDAVTLFSNEMVYGLQGVTYPEPRLRLGPRIPQPISQEAPIQPFSTEMAFGYHPDKPRLFLGPRIESAFIEKQLTFFSFGATESQQAARPQPRRYQRSRFAFNVIAVDSSAIQPDWGIQPARPRIALGPRIDLPNAAGALTPPLVFSPEMVIGSQPSRSRLWIAPRIALPFFVQPEVFFSPEMVFGVTVPRPRLMLGPRIGQPLSQTTHIAAPLSPEMLAGYQPSQLRIVLGPRLALPQLIDVPFVIGPEQTQGLLVDRPRLFLAPKIPLPISQATEIEIAVGDEMISAYVLPARPAPWLKGPFTLPALVHLVEISRLPEIIQSSTLPVPKERTVDPVIKRRTTHKRQAGDA